MTTPSYHKAEYIFRQNHGILRTSQAISLGIAPATLYSMRDSGRIIQENRGIYRLADSPALSNPDLVHVALLVPKAVICLISALSFHQLTTHIPAQVWVSLPREIKKPRLEYPLLEFVWRSPVSYSSGIVSYSIDEVPVHIYDREKTLADCLRYENRIGRDTFLDALKEYKRKSTINVAALMEYARINKVHQRMQSYLEILL